MKRTISGKHPLRLSFFLLLILLLSGCGRLQLFTKLSPERISQISISDSFGNVSVSTSEAAVAAMLEAVNSAEITQQDISDGSFYEYRFMLTGKKPKHSKTFTLYLDQNLDNRSLLIQTDRHLKKIGDACFNLFLAEAVFEPLYPHRLPPQVTLQYDTLGILLKPDRYNWNFQKIDKNYHEATAEGPGNNEDTGLKLTAAGGLPTILTSDKPDITQWTFSQGDQLIQTLINGESSSLPLSDGTYNCLLELQWLEDQNLDFYGKADYAFSVQVDNPPEINISALQTQPGELLVITIDQVNADEEVTIETEFDFKPNVFSQETERVILLPVSYYHKANKAYSVKVTAGQAAETFSVELLDKEFAIQKLTIDPKVAAATRNDQSAAEVKEKIDPLRPVCDPEKYWEGAFIQPVEGGRVRDYDFGRRRYVNNAPTSYRHNGLDIAHNQGEPVKAANHGRVLFADMMIGTGNTVIIEHGFGLKSWYYHMVSLNTKAGDMVKKGDLIGLVGSTGFSTGPHLHYAVSVNNVYVNPMPLFDKGVPLNEKDNVEAAVSADDTSQ